jgi:hypothetical protein
MSILTTPLCVAYKGDTVRTHRQTEQRTTKGCYCMDVHKSDIGHNYNSPLPFVVRRSVRRCVSSIMLRTHRQSKISVVSRETTGKGALNANRV